MRQSQLFTKTNKEAPKDEASINAQLLIKAGFIDKVSAGIYSYLPLGLKVLNNINNIIREEINAIGGQEILMPALTPKENWQKTNRWDIIDVLFKLKGQDKKEYALGATHEEIVTPLAQKFVLSYKDLPAYIYQIQNKFRDELRARSGLIRCREFLMKDLYSFHANEGDLEEYYEKAKSAYYTIFHRCGLGQITYLTFASGGAFSKYSHEFQTVSPTGEDTIYLCEKCKIAINKEIKNETSVCSQCGDKKFQEKKSVEVGNIFPLKTKFSDSFNFKFKDKNGQEQPVMMGCYGIGPGRVMGTVVETNYDARGIIWPKEIAPFKIHLLTIGNDSKIIQRAEAIYETFLGQDYEILYDDRDITAGEKFADADLIGIPLRLVISEKTLKENSVEIKKRNESKTQLVKINELQKFLLKA